MCGIFGVCGTPTCNVVPFVLSALQQLTYRGYDSAGIAVCQAPVVTTPEPTDSVPSSSHVPTPLSLVHPPAPHTIGIRRAPGKLTNLLSACREHPISGSTSIGHTRWATHGVASLENAHPHTSRHFSLVHNGIVENYLDLQINEQLHHFTSQTDTEHIVALLETVYEDAIGQYTQIMNQSGNEASVVVVNEANEVILPPWVILEILAFVSTLLEGSFACAVIYSAQPDAMYALKRGSPLCIGHIDSSEQREDHHRNQFGGQIGFISSDAGCLAGCSKVTYLPDNSIAFVSSSSYYTYSIIAPVEPPHSPNQSDQEQQQQAQQAKPQQFSFSSQLIDVQHIDHIANLQSTRYAIATLPQMKNQYFSPNVDTLSLAQDEYISQMIPQQLDDDTNESSSPQNDKKQPKIRMILEINQQPELVQSCLDSALHFQPQPSQQTVPKYDLLHPLVTIPWLNKDNTLVAENASVSALRQANTNPFAWSELKQLYFIACGTSFHAGLLAMYLFEAYASPSAIIRSIRDHIGKETEHDATETAPLSPLPPHVSIFKQILAAPSTREIELSARAEVASEVLLRTPQFHTEMLSITDIHWKRISAQNSLSSFEEIISRLRDSTQQSQIPLISALSGQPYDPVSSPEPTVATQPISIPTSAFVFLSQSGETSDVCACLERIVTQIAPQDPSQRPPILSFVNVPQSTLARQSDFSLNIAAGQELSVASTKAFTMQVMWLILCVINARFHYLATQQLFSNSSQSNRNSTSIHPIYLDPLTVTLCQGLLQLPTALHHISTQFNSIPLAPSIAVRPLSSLASRNEQSLAACVLQLMQAKSCVVLGRGLLYPIALECALKLKELTYIPTEGCAAGELKHGPLAVVDEQVVSFALMPYNSSFHRTLNNVQEVLARHGVVFIITDEAGQFHLQHAFGQTSDDDNTADDSTQRSHHIFVVPDVHEIVQPLVCTMLFQFIVLHVAFALDRDIDQPRNLAKSVTVE